MIEAKLYSPCTTEAGRKNDGVELIEEMICVIKVITGGSYIRNLKKEAL